MATSEVSVSDENDLADLHKQIDEANIRQAIRLCDKYNLQYEHAESLDAIKNILYEHIEKEKEKNGEKNKSDTVAEENLQRILKNIMEKDAEMKEFLNTVYVLINELIEMPQFDECFNAELTTRYGDYRTILKTNQEKLKQVNCPIVVTGETSAGKSSLLNRLIGSKILPVTLLSCTSVICKLRNSEEKMVVMYDENDTEAKRVVVNNDDDLTKVLKEYTCFGDDINYDKKQYKYADIYWPIPMLPENVIIVDTPGIGDSEEITTTVLEYLEHAIAFIYVINSAHAGGVQSDRILRIINYQRKLKEEGKLQIFDPRLAVFVCNKWDQVPMGEKEEVWANTKRKLERSWMGLQDNQVIEISVHEENRRQNVGLHYTESFRRLLNFVKTITPASLEGKVKMHAIWMKDFLNLVGHSNVVKINFSFKTLEEKKETKMKIETRLDKLTDKNQQIKGELLDFLHSRRYKIAQDLFYHLKIHREKLSTWTIYECPSSETIEPKLFGIFSKDYLKRTKDAAKEIIISRLQVEISDWLLDNDDVSNLQEDISKEFNKQLQLIQDESNIIQQEMRGCSLSDRNLYPFSSKKITNPFENLLGVSGTFDFIETASKSPFFLFSVPFAAIVMAVFNAFYQKKAKQCKEHYKENRQKYMKEWTLEFLDSLNEPSLRDWLDEWYFRDVMDRVKSLCDDMIPKIIETDWQIINRAFLDENKTADIFKLRQTFNEKVAECQRKVLLFNLLYLSDRFIHQDRLRKGELIGEGTCAYVFKSEFSVDGEWLPVALKQSKYPSDNSASYLQLQCLENAHDFDHPNVLKIYGASVSDDGKDMVLEIVTELCEMTMRDMIDKTSCGEMANGTEEFAKAFKLFMNFTIQIAEGLEYIHSRECVHMDLKLEKILIQKDRVKIGHVGFTKEKNLANGSVNESLSASTYSLKENIYSFGKIMWQMWRDKRASDESLKDMQSALMKGVLSSFPLLEELLDSCLHDDPMERPNIAEVRERLTEIRNQHIS